MDSVALLGWGWGWSRRGRGRWQLVSCKVVTRRCLTPLRGGGVLTPLKSSLQEAPPPFPKDPGGPKPTTPAPRSPLGWDISPSPRSNPKHLSPPHNTFSSPPSPPPSMGTWWELGASVSPGPRPQPAARHRPGYSWWPSGPRHPQLWRRGQNPIITGTDSPGLFPASSEQAGQIA